MTVFRLAAFRLHPIHEPAPSSLVERFRRAFRRYRQRRALAELDDRLLADVGITRCEVEDECRKPPWR